MPPNSRLTSAPVGWTPSAFHPRARFCAAITRSNSPRTRVSPFAVPKGTQLFIGAHDETLSVAVRVSNPDCSPFTIHGYVAPAPSGFAEIVSDVSIRPRGHDTQ